MGSDSIIWVIKILIPIYLPWSPNFGGVVYAKIIFAWKWFEINSYAMILKYGGMDS